MSTTLLPSLPVPTTVHPVYACGPEPWAEDVRRTTEAAGLPADRFHVESFGW
ncbi:hypothetical protein [Geodermatophilus sp. TF02-6]|uniref:hypothetical protein n=1 Tax=Geodermatophilus sp. TF02-6 TaxID=2250575 RepID=UPI001314FA31|nr:hypothetical protein [Geodermatophilus sp. TF02-6]